MPNEHVIQGSILLLLLVLSLLPACIAPRPQVNWNDPRAIASGIEVTRDDFKKLTIYEGPNCAIGFLDMAFLRAWKHDGSGRIEYQFYVADHLDDYQWHFYDTAFDDGGNPLPLHRINQKVDSCSSSGCALFEHVGVDMTSDYLRAHQQSGIRVQISGRGGKEVFFVPPSYVQVFVGGVR